MSGTRSILRNTGEPINTAIDKIQQARAWNSIPELPPGMSTAPAGGSFGGMDASDGGEEFGVQFGEVQEPIMIGGTGPRAAPTFVGGFSSSHPGGANFAMGDGSIRYIVETLSMSVYRNLGHRADGELVELE